MSKPLSEWLACEPLAQGNKEQWLRDVITYSTHSPWIAVGHKSPPLLLTHSDKPYVLAVDSKGRMSVGYAYEYSSGEIGWVFSKPISDPTHWMPLPNPPV